MSNRPAYGAGPNDSSREAKHNVFEQDPKQGGEFGAEGKMRKPILDNDVMGIEELDERWESSYDQFERSGDINDIEKAIEYATLALESTPEADPALVMRHSRLGNSYHDRFRRLGTLDDLERAMKLGARAVELTPPEHPNLPLMLGNLGNSCGYRFQQLGDIHDLEKATEYHSRALALTPNGHPDLPHRHASLGVSYRYRFERLGEVDDLEKAIEHHSRALVLTSYGHPELSRRYAHLGVVYTDRFRHLGEMNDLEKAIKFKSRALTLTPDGDMDLSHRHDSLAVSYTDRFERLGNMNDLETAIEHFSLALALTPDGHPDLSRQHASLGLSYTYRFQRLGEMYDLNTSIDHHSRAVELIPDSHPDLSLRHANLGVSYGYRYERMGAMSDLEMAIEHDSRALELTPNDHPELSHRHACLGASYTDRFKHLGEIHDLEKAIEHHSFALALTPGGHPDLARRHASLGSSYGNRFRQSGQIQDLATGIKHHSHALALTPEGHPDLPDRHADLGVSYNERYKLLGEMCDLEKAIEHKSCALELTPDSHRNLPRRYTGLGASYNERFQHLGEIGDLEKAIEHHSRALALTPDGHPDLPERHSHRAYTFFTQYQHTNNPSHLQSSLNSYRRASELSNGAPRVAFQNALRWANQAVHHGSLNCIEAYQTTINLLPHFVWLGATTAQRYQDLLETENLAINAANAAILHSDPNLALEWLEHARCVVWNQSLMLRTPLDHLQSSHPDLALRLQTVSMQLHEASSQPSIPQAQATGSENFEQIARNRRRLAQEYSSLLAEARALPGFETFLQPMKANQLVHAARYGPVVVINCHDDRCDALVILPGEDGVMHLPLPDFTAKQAHESRVEFQMSGLRQRGVKHMPQPDENDRVAEALFTLWIRIVKPVLDLLRYTSPVSGDTLPHITWCPIGALSFLPLHAAGDYRQTGLKVFDYVISSYAPTITSLFGATPSVLGDDCQVLAIGQPYTPGHSPLPGTTEELAYIKAHTQNKVKFSQLVGNHAATKTVLDAMERHDWVHLACHAHQNVEDPTHSGFYLHDGTLDLASISRRQFSRKGLAFLSACQTATGDEKLPDEAVHLASGMLMAGYTSVIATMWSVNDSDAPLVADKVYERLMEDRKLGNGEAGRALHYAVGELRKTVGENAFGRWVPYIHIGS